MTGLSASSIAAYPNGDPSLGTRTNLFLVGSRRKELDQERGHRRRLPPCRGGGSWEWGMGTVSGMGRTAPSSSEFQQGLSEALIKLRLTTAGCLASPERVHRAPLTPCLLVICSDCSITFPSVALLEMDQVS